MIYFVPTWWIINEFQNVLSTLCGYSFFEQTEQDKQQAKNNYSTMPMINTVTTVEAAAAIANKKEL